MNYYIYIFFAIVSVFYAVMLIVFAIAWFKRIDNVTYNNLNEFISIIIVFRNEEKNLYALIQSLLSQDYAYDFEILLINDHSEDDSIAIINEFSDDRLIVVELPENIYGKKQALRYAAKNAKGDILVFADADCVMSKEWLSSISGEMYEKSLDMICGPVEFISRNTVFSKLIELEFLSLTGSGAAGFFLDYPFMCNAANYAIKKSVFIEAFQHINDKYSSGDDVFLLHYVTKHYSVDFIKNMKAVVKTQAPQGIFDFFNQRIRWASKVSGYRTISSFSSAIITFFMSFIIILSFGLTILDSQFFLFSIVLLSLKTILDVIFLVPVLSFHKKISLLVFVPLLQISYPFYILITGILSLVSKPKWKGRKIRA